MTADPVGTRACEATLRRLLQRAEGQVFGAASRTSLKVTPASVPEYFSLEGYPQRQAYHARARNAQQSGAVVLEWDKRAGEDGQLARVSLASAKVLAGELGQIPAWEIAEQGKLLVGRWEVSVPRVRRYLDAWSVGRKLRGKGADQAPAVSDACSVLAYLAGRDTTQGDALVRRLSISLFGDSKRIEDLTSILDQLTSESDEPNAADVLERLGLVKHPQPLLIAGTLRFESAAGLAPCLHPYSGIAPDALRRVEFEQDAPVLASIENLATFNELARDLARPPGVVLLYSAGMPTPSFLRAYDLILGCAPARSVLVHWGDLDRGGYRAAHCLWRVAAARGRALRPWNMGPDIRLSVRAPVPRMLDASKVASMNRLAGEMGWPQIEESCDGVAWVEQEGVCYSWSDLLAD